MRITKTTARKVLEVVDQGLVKGLGLPKPGAMCVEAAVCYALGLPHSDQPLCVSPALRDLKIILNDAPWSSNEARTAGLRKLALLQLGTNVDFDEKLFSQRVALFTINVTVADLFESFEWGKEHAAAMRAATDLTAADAAAWSARAAAWSARAANAAARAAAWSANAAWAADAAAWSAAWSARATAWSAADAANAAAAEAANATANATAWAANAAFAAARAANAAARDRVLGVFSAGVAEILVDMGVPGAKWLDLL